MLVSKKLAFLLLLFTFTLISCAEDFMAEPEIRSYPNVQQSLWGHFEDFEHEARIRGLEIDLNAHDLTASISEIEDDGVAGVCQYGNHQTNNVIIDADFWDRTGFSSREFVVFHELGHCVLSRDHREAQNANGSCISIMASGTGDCRFNYTTLTRESYLDELFSFEN